VLTVSFTLDGSDYVALNGGPQFKFSPAASLVANCHTQEELVRLWRQLCEGGQEGRCDWLTNKSGMSWQIVPRPTIQLLLSEDHATSQRAFAAVTTMNKPDIAAEQRAYDGH
jgi:predicted 3-demethylubiquinone-9 3-methyltransferase (glyoxalase superfamily)